MHNYLAQTKIGTIGGNGLGPYGNIAPDATTALTKITQVVSSVIGVMTLCSVLWFMMQILMGGMSWISAGGDKNKMEEAKNRITNAFIGLLIVVAGWMLLALVGKFFGTDFLLTDPATIIKNFQLTP